MEKVLKKVCENFVLIMWHDKQFTENVIMLQFSCGLCVILYHLLLKSVVKMAKEENKGDVISVYTGGTKDASKRVAEAPSY